MRMEPSKANHTVSAYADESITDEVVVCAAAVFSVDRVAEAETALNSIKAGLGLPQEASLHCSQIFHGNKRQGTPWGRIPAQEIDCAIEKLCTELAGICLRPVIFVAPRSPIVIPGPPGTESKSRSLDTKGQAAMGFQTLGFHLTRQYGFGTVKMWVDPDSTKIPWLNGNAQANSTRSGFMDLGPEFEPPKFEPLIVGNPKPVLLEIADLYAYASSRAHSRAGGWKNRWFQKIYSIISPERLVWQFTNQEPKWESSNAS
jgi:hypothetical protein